MAIWVLGLCNPYTFDVQPGAGRILINDVGRATYKEINHGARGANYELPLREGGAGKRPQILGTSPLLCSRLFLDHGMRDHRGRILQSREHLILARLRR
jgi:glucose/arabinose dehydrogenase